MFKPMIYAMLSLVSGGYGRHQPEFVALTARKGTDLEISEVN